jgi:hypothetical protein
MLRISVLQNNNYYVVVLSEWPNKLKKMQSVLYKRVKILLQNDVHLFPTCILDYTLLFVDLYIRYSFTAYLNPL